MNQFTKSTNQIIFFEKYLKINGINLLINNIQGFSYPMNNFTHNHLKYKKALKNLFINNENLIKLLKRQINKLIKLKNKI